MNYNPQLMEGCDRRYMKMRTYYIDTIDEYIAKCNRMEKRDFDIGEDGKVRKFVCKNIIRPKTINAITHVIYTESDGPLSRSPKVQHYKTTGRIVHEDGPQTCGPRLRRYSLVPSYYVLEYDGSRILADRHLGNKRDITDRSLSSVIQDLCERNLDPRPTDLDKRRVKERKETQLQANYSKLFDGKSFLTMMAYNPRWTYNTIRDIIVNAEGGSIDTEGIIHAKE